ncbi:MAG: CocE/NonD family hydrolase C-terminal non-catalytic domain-containing protein [Anaerolineae bacterium]
MARLRRYPPRSTAVRYYLDDPLCRKAPTDADRRDTYVYDPADPTPAVGGTQFGLLGGPRDNRDLEARPDVLVYTSDVLHEDLEVIGAVKLELYVRSSCAHTDFFGRVRRASRRQIGQYLRRAVSRPAGQGRAAARRQPAHRDRPVGDGTLPERTSPAPLLVSSGAHPRWSRNLGAGEPLSTATTMCVAMQTVYRDSAIRRRWCCR